MPLLARDPGCGRLRAPRVGDPGGRGLDAVVRAAAALARRAQRGRQPRRRASRFAAISPTLADDQFVEVILWTLPRRSSVWLRRDLVRRVEKLGLPVTAIVPGKSRVSKEEELEIVGMAGLM